MNNNFRDTVKNAVDIVRVVGDYVRLQRLGGTARYRANCPFHGEKTPSFYVHADRQFYKCFGCGKGGDVFTFVMEIEGLSFYEALKQLAERNGIPVPKLRDDGDPESRQRAGIQELHEIAATHFQELLRGPSGEAARGYLARRGVSEGLAEEFGLGMSDTGGGLARLFLRRGVPEDMLESSGLCMRRQEGNGFYDRFRGRLMFPIKNESGKVIAFGGRTMGDDQPKYLNSPETALYKKSHTLYNLNRAKEGARRNGRLVLVEGYMDVIGVSSAGVREVVASCGTALTPQQARGMKRHADRVVVNFDPDNAGANATERSIQILLEESLQIRVCSLSGGLDPDEYVKENGVEAYLQALEKSPGYFYWLADRARARFDTRTAEGRMEAFRFLTPAIQKLPDKLERLAIVNDVATQLGVEPSAVLDEFRKTAGERNARPTAVAAPESRLPESEKILLRLLLHHGAALTPYVDTILSLEMLPYLQSRRILETTLPLLAADGALDFNALQARLQTDDAALLAALLSSDTENVERELSDPAAQLERCLAKLERDGLETRRKELRMKIREAERAGNLSEAMRLMEDERKLERTARMT